MNSEINREKAGPIAWMARNSVASNLLMLVFIGGGLLLAGRAKMEVFPEFDQGMVRITVPYPGANPSEVEQGIVLAVEEAVQGLDGVKKVEGQAVEGLGAVMVTMLVGADGDRVTSDVKNAVDRITSFPIDAEEPVVAQVTNRQQVVSVIIHGDQTEETLRRYAETVRRDLLALDDIVLVELTGVRPREISIEVPRHVLSGYGLTLDQIAGAVRAASLELSGGSVKTSGGEVLIRTNERRDFGGEFEDIALLATPGGSRVRLGDIAVIRDGFRETDQQTFFDGQPAVKIDIYRVGNQTPVEVSKAAHGYVDHAGEVLPPGIKVAVWNDYAEVLEDRINLLLRNAVMGLILIQLVLGIFLETKLAFWVLMGIPISFLGAFLFMPALGVSVNMISLFAFIVGLGIVVDDAIVIGENVYHHRQEGMDRIEAAVLGAKQMAMPVIFAVLTTVAAFSPLLAVPGPMGKIFKVIPLIVISVLVLSVVESLLILPSHLGHSAPSSPTGVLGTLARLQKRVRDALKFHNHNTYPPFAKWVVTNRYLTVAIGVALQLIVVGLVAGGRIDFVFFPKIEGDLVKVSVRLPVGASLDDALRITKQVENGVRRVVARYSAQNDTLVRGLYTQIGEEMGGFGPHRPNAVDASGAHVVEVALFLVPLKKRTVTASELSTAWREEVGHPPGVKSINFAFNIGPSVGWPIDIQLAHTDPKLLEAAAGRLADEIQFYAGVTSVDPGFGSGKTQFDFKLKPAARNLGLTEKSLARQLRSGFFGTEALRQQRGRDEVRVMVRLPKSDRYSQYGLEQLRLRTPSGSELPLAQAATITGGKAYTSVRRVDGQRVLNVTGDVDQTIANANQIIARVRAELLPELLRDYPGVRYSLEGVQREQQESMQSLLLGFVMAQLAIYCLLAVPFRSYIQPLVVMSAIPFGLIGAILGHMVLGYELSIVSVMGFVALTGVVVNDSLVLIVAINELRAQGVATTEAVVEGGIRRLRPILLTSLTTFFGLAPIILETSVQARFMIPMAISLAFGILFATGIILLLVPALYMISEDVKRLFARALGMDLAEPALVESPAAAEVV